MGLFSLAVDAVVPWYIRWPLKAFGVVKAGIQWAFSNTTHMLIAALVLVGFFAAVERHEAIYWKGEADRIQKEWDADRKQAEDAAKAAQIDARKNADDAQQKYNQAVSDGQDLLAGYIAANRVRPAPQADAPRAGQDRPSAVPANPTPGPIVAQVAVSEADLKTCDADYAYAQSAYEWAQGINRGRQ